MADDLRQTLDRVMSKARLLAQRYATLAERKNAADRQIEDLLQRIDRQQQQIEDLKQQVEYLRIASTIASNREDVERTRHILSGLVREIDYCIKQLND